MTRRTALGVCVAAIALAAATSRTVTVAADTRLTLPIARVDVVGFTVSDMERSIEFYTRLLTFHKIADIEVTDRPFELLSGVFGARARIVTLALGDERLELTEFRAPRGRPIPGDARSNDRSFQHVAIIVSDMDRAYRRLREAGVEHGSTGPQTLPAWNRGAAGVRAFYFRDPDRHFLEVLSFPADKGLPKWHVTGDALFLGIDHTAIVVDDTDASLAFYRDTLGFVVAGESENYDLEQEHLNNVFGARLRITALRASGGPGIELLEYLAPRDGRPAPVDERANDIGHWQTTLVADSLDPVLPLARAHRLSLVSPGPVALPPGFGFSAAALVRDPDGHGLRMVVR
jgi:catechol 2,3-dioxygenase-like lactoylglutathione lyase family enzyme